MTKLLLSICLFLLFSVYSFGQNETLPQSGDRFTYDVTADPESASANLLQILQKLPFVNVDAGNIISIPGCTQVVLYINGIPQTGISNSLYLQTLPASRVERVEIYTQPKASKQLTNDAGLINVITKKQEGEGTSLFASAHGATSSAAGADVLLTTRHKKFFLDGGYAFGYRDKYEYTFKDTYISPTEYGSTHIKQHNISLHTGLELTDRDVVGATAVVLSNEQNNYNNDPHLPTIESKYSRPAYNLATYYKHSFAQGASLKLTYEYNNNKSDNETGSFVFNTRNHANNIQTDLSILIGSAGAFDAGGRYSAYRSKTYSKNPYEQNEYSTNINTWTVYAQYTHKWSQLQMALGVLGWDSDEEDHSFRINPYASLLWNIDAKQNISFQYSVQRVFPTFPEGSSDQYGYRPLHKLDVNYHYTHGKLQLTGDANYKLSPNYLTSSFPYYTPIYDDSRFQQFLLSFYARYALSTSVSVYGGGLFAYQHYKYGDEQDKQHATLGQLSAGSDIYFTPDFCLTINGGYNFPRKIEDSKEKQNYFYRMNLSKEFVKRWKVALYANDFFGEKKLKNYYADKYTPRTNFRYTYPTNEFGISLTYRIL